MSLMDYVKSISIFNPAMGQTSTKEENMTVTNEQMTEAQKQLAIENINKIIAETGAIDPSTFVDEIDKAKLVQTEADVGGTPIEKLAGGTPING